MRCSCSSQCNAAGAPITPVSSDDPRKRKGTASRAQLVSWSAVDAQRNGAAAAPEPQNLASKKRWTRRVRRLGTTLMLLNPTSYELMILNNVGLVARVWQAARRHLSHRIWGLTERTPSASVFTSSLSPSVLLHCPPLPCVVLPLHGPSLVRWDICPSSATPPRKRTDGPQSTAFRGLTASTRLAAAPPARMPELCSAHYKRASLHRPCSPRLSHRSHLDSHPTSTQPPPHSRIPFAHPYSPCTTTSSTADSFLSTFASFLL